MSPLNQGTVIGLTDSSTGAMLSLSAISVPVLLDTNTNAAHSVHQWARLYHYGHIELPFLCVTTTFLYAYAARRKRYVQCKQWSLYAWAGVVTMIMVPFTWIFMDTTVNSQLFGWDALPVGSSIEMGSVRGVLVRWAFLHATRSLFPMIGAVMGLVGVFQEVGVLEN